MVVSIRFNCIFSKLVVIKLNLKVSEYVKRLDISNAFYIIINLSNDPFSFFFTWEFLQIKQKFLQLLSIDQIHKRFQWLFPMELEPIPDKVRLLNGVNILLQLNSNL